MNTCETCQHEREKSNEHCGLCGSGKSSNWLEADWIKDTKIHILKNALEKIIHNSKIKNALEKIIKIGLSTEHTTLVIAQKALTDIERNIDND